MAVLRRIEIGTQVSLSLYWWCHRVTTRPKPIVSRCIKSRWVPEWGRCDERVENKGHCLHRLSVRWPDVLFGCFSVRVGYSETDMELAVYSVKKAWITWTSDGADRIKNGFISKGVLGAIDYGSIEAKQHRLGWQAFLVCMSWVCRWWLSLTSARQKERAFFLSFRPSSPFFKRTVHRMLQLCVCVCPSRASRHSGILASVRSKSRPLRLIQMSFALLSRNGQSEFMLLENDTEIEFVFFPTLLLSALLSQLSSLPSHHSTLSSSAQKAVSEMLPWPAPARDFLSFSQFACERYCHLHLHQNQRNQNEPTRFHLLNGPLSCSERTFRIRSSDAEPAVF